MHVVHKDDRQETDTELCGPRRPVHWQCLLPNSSPPASSRPFPVPPPPHPPPPPPVFLGVSARGEKSGRYIEVCLQGKYRGRFACAQGIYCALSKDEPTAPPITRKYDTSKCYDIHYYYYTYCCTTTINTILQITRSAHKTPPRECIMGHGRPCQQRSFLNKAHNSLEILVHSRRRKYDTLDKWPADKHKSC